MLKDKKIWSGFSLLLAKKIELFEGLLKLSRKQTVVISDEDWDQLQTLLDKKERLIKEVDGLDERINPIVEEIIEFYNLDKKDWAEGLEKIGEIPGDIKGSLKRLSNLLEQLREINGKNLTELKDKRIELNEGMARLQEGRKVNKKYNNSQRIYSTFIDKKG